MLVGPDFLWTGANEDSNFGVDVNYLMTVIVKVQLLVALELGRGHLSEHLLVAHTLKMRVIFW